MAFLTRRVGLAIVPLSSERWRSVLRGQAPRRSGPRRGRVRRRLVKNALDDINQAWYRENRQEGDHLLRGQLGAGQADRGGRAGRHLHLGRPRLDGLPAQQQEPDQAGHALQPARQQPRADRAEGQQRQRSTIAARLRPRRLLGDGRLAMANVECGAGRQIRQGGAREARRLGQRGRQGRAGRERARRAAAGRARRGARSASSTRPTPPPSRTSRSSAPSRRTRHPPIVYPVALTAELGNAGRARPSSPICVGLPPSRCSRHRASPCSSRPACWLRDGAESACSD